MRVIITGAQFKNKGAQSLLFCVVNELYNRYGNPEIYYVPLDDFRNYDTELYRFNIVCGENTPYRYEHHPCLRSVFIVEAMLKKMFGKGRMPVKDVVRLHNVLKDADVLIDISGFQIGSVWSVEHNLKELNYVHEAKRYGTKVVFMPQSFGPFDYGDKQASMDKAIKESLSKADLIFAREEEGYQWLTEKYGLTNVYRGLDTVLQAHDLNLENIYNVPVEKPVIRLKTENNVGIVPNFESLRTGNEEVILNLYEAVVKRLMALGKNVYIFRHSKDLEVCRKIYEPFRNAPSVYLLEDDLDCIQYLEFVKQFDFIIASRYHSIVHAYKEGVPAVILGWAVKYRELAQNFAQSDYIFDITKLDTDDSFDTILESIENMSVKHREEKYKIEQKRLNNNENSCFDMCWRILDHC